MTSPAARSLRTLHTRASLASGPVLLTCAGVMALLGQEAVALWLLIVGTVVSMYWPLLVNVAYEYKDERTEERRR